jgi:hypothetical protein
MAPMNNRLMRPRAKGGFDPKSITGLALWLDGASLASGSVATWSDKSGNGRDATQTTPNNQPTTTTMNGRNAVLFDGSNDFLNVAGITFSTAPYSALVVYSHPAQRFQAILNELPPIQSLNYLALGLTSTNGIGLIRVGNAAQASNLSAAVNTTNVIAWLGDGSSTSSQTVSIRRNGVAASADITLTGITTSPAATRLTVGGFIGGDLCGGTLAEMVLYNRRLTLSETQSLETYLATKWGATLA